MKHKLNSPTVFQRLAKQFLNKGNSSVQLFRNYMQDSMKSIRKSTHLTLCEVS